jgi:hypothetical protein
MDWITDKEKYIKEHNPMSNNIYTPTFPSYPTHVSPSPSYPTYVSPTRAWAIDSLYAERMNNEAFGKRFDNTIREFVTHTKY